MHHLIRNNNPFTAILLFVFTLLVHLQALSHPILPKASDAAFLFGWLLHFLSIVLGTSAFAHSLLAVILVYVQALYVNKIAIQYRLFQQNNYLVAFAFIILNSLNPSFGQLNAQLILNFFVLFSISELFFLKQVSKPNKHLFNIGFALMTAALIQFSAVFLILFLFLALLFLRPFSPKEWMVSALGLFMPLYFLWVILFCTNKLSLLSKWVDLGISLPRTISEPTYFLGLLLGLILWGALSIYNMQIQMSKAIIYIRRCWLSIILLLIFSVLAAVFTDSQVSAVWLICLPALSLVLAFGFINERTKKMNAISFYFALLFMIFCQLFLPF